MIIIYYYTQFVSTIFSFCLFFFLLFLSVSICDYFSLTFSVCLCVCLFPCVSCVCFSSCPSFSFYSALSLSVFFHISLCLCHSFSIYLFVTLTFSPFYLSLSVSLIVFHLYYSSAYDAKQDLTCNYLPSVFMQLFRCSSLRTWISVPVTDGGNC
jgi:hypothetical protein